MPKYLITLSRSKEQLASFQLESTDALSAHAAARHVKRQVLLKEKKDTFGNPKIAEDITIVTQLVSDV